MVVPTTRGRGLVPGNTLKRAPRPVVRAEKNITKPEARTPSLEEIVSSNVTEEEDEISSGDVDSQLKELEPKVDTERVQVEDVFYDVANVEQLVNAPLIAEVGWVSGCSAWWKWNAMYFGLMLMAAMMSLAFAVYLKVRLDGLDLGPPPT